MRARLKTQCFNSLMIKNVKNIQFLKNSTFNPRFSNHNHLNSKIIL